MGQPRRIYIDGAAVICGLCCYFPIPGLRGAAFCLFPGLAQRSSKLAIKGAALGCVADIGVLILATILFGVWEPRWSYNRALVQNLPPGYMVMTHVGSPLPNSLKFGFGLILWTSTMYAIWMHLWTPRLEWERRLPILAVGVVAVGVCARILWIVAPLDEWWQHGDHQPYGDLSPEPFLAVFLTTMPSCALLIALFIHLASKRQTAEKLTESPENHCARGTQGVFNTGEVINPGEVISRER